LEVLTAFDLTAKARIWPWTTVYVPYSLDSGDTVVPSPQCLDLAQLKAVDLRCFSFRGTEAPESAAPATPAAMPSDANIVPIHLSRAVNLRVRVHV